MLDAFKNRAVNAKREQLVVDECRELERLRAENVRLSRLLDLRGQGTAPAPAGPRSLPAGVA